MTSQKTARNLTIVTLLFLATCSEEAQSPGSFGIEAARKILGKVPATEVATWQRVGSSSAPDGVFLQAIAFDKTREVVVMFGGQNILSGGGTPVPNQETWEWAPTSGKWTKRATTGALPAARGGASMVFDSARNKFVLFGGRAASGYNYEDTWEWDPTTAAWTDRTSAGTHPSARAQQGMVYEKSTGKILLFGGGRSNSSSSDGTSVSTSLGDTWELDPTTSTWTALSPAASPSVRHDFGLVWDSARNKAVLFGGMQIDIPGATGVPKQDTWEWDPAAGTWTERATSGDRPSQRYGHAMAFDGGRGKVVVFGGWDMTTAGSKNDLWDWDPTSATWTQLLSGTEAGVPTARTYASLVSDDARSRLELLAGEVMSNSSGGTGGVVGSNEVWELDPAALVFTNKTPARDFPNGRIGHAMAYNPSTGKVYVYGGMDPMTKGMDTMQAFDDLWEWDGKIWTEIITDQRPSGRIDAALAYDPARTSLILFGGMSYSSSSSATLNDTWEWNGTTRKWAQLETIGRPDQVYGHSMVTDPARNKILLFGGFTTSTSNQVWEWDGSAYTWTNRTPVTSSNVPMGRTYPVVTYDEGRQKLFLYDGVKNRSLSSESLSAFWEWDPITTGWALRDPGDSLDDSSYLYAAYDPVRRRNVVLTDASSNGNSETWEADAKAMTWYVRSLPNTPTSRYRAAMAFDKGRGAVVLFGGMVNAGSGSANETWEYTVANLGNGEGCTAASAASCASGNCVDDVCCESTGCSGACKSCNVPGSEGTCMLAQAGTEVPGSCSDGQACDGTGSCKSKNGQACTSTGTCASGFCVNGICCDSACTGTCVACNLSGRAGTCSAHPAGTDPNGECDQGTGVCKSTCDGVGACTFPQSGVSCGACLTCDGAGTCAMSDPTCGSGGPGVSGKGGNGGSVTSTGGSGGSVTSTGGSGGVTSTAGNIGTSPLGGGGSSGGAGSTISSGGTGGRITSFPSGGSGGNAGGSTSPDTGSTARGGSGGAFDAGSSGSGGQFDGGGSASLDGAGDDAALGVSLHRGGCACELGRGETPGWGLRPWMVLIGAGLLARRLRPRRPNGRRAEA
jgi:hypothetical protein